MGSAVELGDDGDCDRDIGLNHEQNGLSHRVDEFFRHPPSNQRAHQHAEIEPATCDVPPKFHPAAS
jgi:hypothetical protein